MSLNSTMTSLMDGARNHFEVTNKLSINNLVNLFNPNPNLLAGSADWGKTTFTNFGSQVVLTDDTYKGYKVVRCVQAWTSPQAVIQLKNGVTYTFSLYAKADKDIDGYFFTWLTGQDDFNEPANHQVKLTSNWQKFAFTFRMKGDYTLHLRLEAARDGVNMYQAGFKVEVGDLATPFEKVGEG